MHEVLASSHEVFCQVCKHMVFDYLQNLVVVSYRSPLLEHHEETRLSNCLRLHPLEIEIASTRRTVAILTTGMKVSS
jgi:hypothetical protein